MSVTKLLVGPIVAFLMMLGISVGMAEPSIAGDVAHHVSFITNDIAQHISFLASNGEWHAGAIAVIANIKYLTTKQVAERYAIDPRSVPRRVAEQLLPKPYYFGTRFPRWDIAELDENDRKLASVRAERKAAKPKPAEKKPARPCKARAAAAASPDDHAAASAELR
jgi:hypothetical protein